MTERAGFIDGRQEAVVAEVVPAALIVLQVAPGERHLAPMAHPADPLASSIRLMFRSALFRNRFIQLTAVAISSVVSIEAF
jgi:hypothetical protein